MKFDAYRGGQLIYQADADKLLIYLLIKRYNPKTKYSISATRILMILTCQLICLVINHQVNQE